MKITAQQLEDFAAKGVSKGLLPELIRRLIRATGDRLEDILFPSGESTFRPGADGLLRAQGRPPYIPDGVSLWEVSAEKDPPKKGRRDIDKRSLPDATDRYLDTPRSGITYIALTLRRWHTDDGVDRDNFEAEQRARGVWKDVKTYDAEHLEDWLDQAPSVRAWLARKIGIASDDMRSIEDFWEDYRSGITPRMSEELLLLSRKEEAEKLVSEAALGGVFRVKADSPNEAAAFVAASLLTLPGDDPRREMLLAKGVVITKPESQAFLTDIDQKLFVIALGRATEVAGVLASRGHTVVVAYGNSHTVREGNSPLFDLRKPKSHELVQTLVAMGMSEGDARTTAGKCHCSITVLYRIRDLANSRRPDWATYQQLGRLVGPLLCGAWKHASPADCEVVAEVAGMPYTQVETGIHEVLHLDDPPLRREGDLTALSAPADIWQLSMERGLITRDLLERFREVAIKVLGERDPSLDLPSDRRVYADIEGKKRTYSSPLRRGLVEILRLIAINDQNLTSLAGGFSAQQFVDRIARDLPGLSVDYQTLASLDPLLPGLAEAAPDPFLSALETLTGGDSAKLAPIFEGSEDPVFGRTYYLGTLRALEMLAWDPEHFDRATHLLAKLAEIDPGGRLTNRPVNSLVQIFQPWNPNTNVSQPFRQRVLGRLCGDVPSIAWDLLAKLLPKHHSISFRAAEPEWREAGASQRVEPTRQSALQDYELVIRTAMPLAGVDPLRWLDLIEACAAMRHDAQLDVLLSEIEAKHEQFVSDATDRGLWEGLSALAAKHRAFAAANWAMPVSMVQKIEAAAKPFQPADPVARHRHLFDHMSVERLTPEESYEDRRARGELERDAAFQEISGRGREAVFDLARQAKTPGLVAQSLVRTGTPDSVLDFVLAAFQDDEKISWLAALASGIGVSRFGFSWGQSLIVDLERKAATPEQVAALLRVWNDSRELLHLVASKPIEVQVAYWAVRDNFVRSDDTRVVNDAVDQMIQHGRSPELIEFLGGRLDRTDPGVLMRVIAQALEQVVAEPEKLQKVDGYWLREIFEALRKHNDVDRNRLMGLEYAWLPALHSYGEPRVFALHEHMGENPEFFVQVLSDLYRSDAEAANDGNDSTAEQQEGRSSDAGEATEKEQGKADVAYKLLESWQQLPWMNPDGIVDYQRMRDWAKEALHLAASARRRGAGAREIGKLLAYSPNDPIDEAWPHRTVRDLIEELADPEIESAIVIELFNKRGVHWRPSEGGGDPERKLALITNEWADKSQGQWPRTSRLLRDSAKDWLYHAQREDRRAAEKGISL